MWRISDMWRILDFLLYKHLWSKKIAFFNMLNKKTQARLCLLALIACLTDCLSNLMLINSNCTGNGSSHILLKTLTVQVIDCLLAIVTGHYGQEGEFQSGNVQVLKDHSFHWSEDFKKRQQMSVFDRLGGGGRKRGNKETTSKEGQGGSTGRGRGRGKRQ